MSQVSESYDPLQEYDEPNSSPFLKIYNLKKVDKRKKCNCCSCENCSFIVNYRSLTPSGYSPFCRTYGKFAQHDLSYYFCDAHRKSGK